MTTLRDRLNNGTFSLQDRERLIRDFGQTPLCCCHLNEHYIQCDSMDKPLSKEDFNKACLLCQTVMLHRIDALKIVVKES